MANFRSYPEYRLFGGSPQIHYSIIKPLGHMHNRHVFLLFIFLLILLFPLFIRFFLENFFVEFPACIGNLQRQN